MAPILAVQNLKKIFPANIVAVDDISFSLKPGEILGLLGPNGAGKTTTIQMLLSTLTPTSGTIEYFGKDFTKHRSEILKHVVFASTYVSLPWALTIWQNLNIIRRLYGIPKETFNANLDPLLDRFGILDKKHAHVASLSSGQITRLMLVKVFLLNPKVVLLDEPTASLDPDIAKDVCEFILEQRDKQGISFLFTSHKMDEVSKVCDRVLFLQNGKIIANDIPAVLAKSTASCILELLISQGISSAINTALLLNYHHVVDNQKLSIHLDELEISRFLNALAHQNVLYSTIQIHKPTLEDYFIKLTGKRSL